MIYKLRIEELYSAIIIIILKANKYDHIQRTTELHGTISFLNQCQ